MKVKIPEKMQEAAEWANLVDEIETAVEDTSMIVWVGSEDERLKMPWDLFKQAQWNTEYRVEGGHYALAGDLIVVLNDGSWYEWDQSAEEWIHRKAPTLESGFRPFSKVVGQEYTSLEVLNADDQADV